MDFKREIKEEEKPKEEEKCGHCGGSRNNPKLLSDDSYSQFLCPWPFHKTQA